jgi:photosystem II stability/assembly factor-like uncharacterized protein
MAFSVVAASAGEPAGGGLWQGHAYPAAAGTVAESAAVADRFLVLDTGGSGGGFGQGDVRSHLQDVVFWNQQLGWSCGYGGVFKTVDGGLTWTRMKPRGGWYHIGMAGPDEVWLLEGQHPGGIGKVWLWKSTDGGTSWQEHLHGQLGGYADMYVRGPYRWVLCGGFPSYRSDDGGRSWQTERCGGLLHGKLKISIPADVVTPQGFAVYVLGDFKRQRRLVASHDSGRTWSVVLLPDAAGLFRDRMCWATSRRGWLATSDGKMLVTADGGQTWQSRDLPTDQIVNALWCDAAGRGFAAFQNAVLERFRYTLYETRDDGHTWTALLGGQKSVNAFFAFGPGQLWAVGNVPGYVPNDLVVILQQPHGQ